MKVTRCDNQNLRILHALHDFLPRHQAGSEIYALALCGDSRERAGEQALTPQQAEDLLLLDGFVRLPPPELALLPLDAEQITAHLWSGRFSCRGVLADDADQGSPARR